MSHQKKNKINFYLHFVLEINKHEAHAKRWLLILPYFKHKKIFSRYYKRYFGYKIFWIFLILLDIGFFIGYEWLLANYFKRTSK